MSKQLKTSIFLILQQSTQDKTQKGSHIFESIKHSIYELVSNYSTESTPYITENALNFGTIKLIELTAKIGTDDAAPVHKQRIGLKAYASVIARINDLTIFKKNEIKLFEKVQDSCYITSKLANKLQNFTGGYTHTYKLTELGLNFHNIALNTLHKFNKTPKLKDMLGLRKLSAKELEDTDTFKITLKKFKDLHNIYYTTFILGQANEELTNKLKRISLLMKNIIGYRNGYVYVSNKDLSKSKQYREHTVYACLSKTLRTYIHPNNMEVDIDSACISMNLNIFNDIMRQAKCQYITIKRKSGDKHIRRQYNEKDTLVEFPILNSYMNNKYEGRMNIKSAIGLNDINAAKQFLTSINFSSNKGNLEFNPNARKQTVIYTKLLMKEVHKLQKFIHLMVFKTDYQFTIMGKPVQQIRDDINSNIASHRELNPKKFGRGIKLSGKQLARLYFNLEKDIRETMIDYLEEQNITESLQIHDCLVFDKIHKNKLEKHKLERHILEKHGYKLTLSSSEDVNFLTKE